MNVLSFAHPDVVTEVTAGAAPRTPLAYTENRPTGHRKVAVHFMNPAGDRIVLAYADVDAAAASALRADVETFNEDPAAGWASLAALAAEADALKADRSHHLDPLDTIAKLADPEQVTAISADVARTTPLTLSMDKRGDRCTYVLAFTFAGNRRVLSRGILPTGAGDELRAAVDTFNTDPAAGWARLAAAAADKHDTAAADAREAARTMQWAAVHAREMAAALTPTEVAR